MKKPLNTKLGKKANIVAVILIILLVVTSIAVLVFRPFVAEEQHVDYGEIFSDVRSGVERSYFEAFQETMRVGLLEHEGIWYYNAPYGPLNEDTVRERIKERVLEKLTDSFEYEYEGAEVSIEGIEENIEITLEEEGVKVIIDGAEIDIKVNGEERTIEISEDYTIPSDLKNTIESVNTWLECDAGNLTELFGAFHESIPCQFENCCCGKDPLTDDDIAEVVDEYGITRENITMILEKSLETLNHLLSGAESCGEEAEELREDKTCFVSEERSVIEYGTDYIMDQHRDELCFRPTDSCGLVPVGETGDGLLTDWVDPDISFEGEPVENPGLDSDFGRDVNQRLLDPDDETTYLYKVGLERKAAGDVTVVCRSPDAAATDYNELRFRLQFKNKFSCDAPEPAPEEFIDATVVPLQCAAGSAEIPNVCEEQEMLAKSCRHIVDRDDFEHHEHCAITVVCVPKDTDFEALAEQGIYDPETDTMLCADYMEDDSNEWLYPGFDERCEGDQYCGVCGDEARCDEPANDTTICRYFGEDECMVHYCSGDGVGEEHCGPGPEGEFGGTEALVDELCGTNQCGGVCVDDGVCRFDSGIGGSDGDTCSRTIDGCSVYSECVGGSCPASKPANTGQCCPDADSNIDGFCPAGRYFCCDDYCSSDSTCPTPN